MVSIYFVGTYKPMMCGIADYTGYITRESPPKRWGVISFDLEAYAEPPIKNSGMPAGQVWYGIPSHDEFSAPAILKGIEQLGGGKIPFCGSNTNLVSGHMTSNLWLCLRIWTCRR